MGSTTEPTVDSLMAEHGLSRQVATRLLWKTRIADNQQGDPTHQRFEQLLATLGDGRVWHPQPWRERANCHGVATDLFFPTRGDMRTQEQAVAVCRMCEVRAECFRYGMDHFERGVWGGTTERQRRQIRSGYLNADDIR